MENWYDVIKPHKDIIEGKYDLHRFAADLGDVIWKNAISDYGDPREFYKKTYLTKGLENLLKFVSDKLATGRGDPVIQLQTPFGGGKTHALVAIYHMLKNRENVIEFISDLPSIKGVNIGVIVGTYNNAQTGRNVDGINLRTLWGEIAYQIGGVEGYKLMEQNDRNMISPGKELLIRLLRQNEPVILLFDEILEYITKAGGVKVEKETLASQTLCFLQEITETVTSLPRSMLITTLPTGSREDFSEANEEYLETLKHLLARKEHIITPVEGEEVYSVIRKRLFQEDTLNVQKAKEICYRYFDFYQANENDLPEKIRDINYREKMLKAYPFHPELIDTLHERWGTFSSMQRTRGILRFLSLIAGSLYHKEKNVDMILPADIDLGSGEIRNEFLKHIGNLYESVISADILEKAKLMDQQDKSLKHLTEGVATSIFFCSFMGNGASKKGIALPYIKLSVLRPDIIPSTVTGVVYKIDKFWYIHTKSQKYFFEPLPTIEKMIRDKKELHNEDWEEKFKELLRENVGSALKSFVLPASSEDIGDNRELKLILLDPHFDFSKIDDLIEYKGKSFRVYKNTIIFALVEMSTYSTFKEKIKRFLALQDIKREVEKGEHETLKDKKDEICDKIRTIENDFSYNVRNTYRKIFKQTGGQDEVIDLGSPIAGKQHLSNWIKRELMEREMIVSKLHYRILVNRYLQELETFRTIELLDTFYKTPNPIMLDSPEVLKDALCRGVNDGIFGIGYLKEGKYQDYIFNIPLSMKDSEPEKYKKYREIKYKPPIGRIAPIAADAISFSDDEYIISREIILNELEKQWREEEARRQAEAGISPEEPVEEEEGESKKPIPIEGEQTSFIDGESHIRKYRRVKLKIGDIHATKMSDFNRGVILPLSREVGSFDMTMEINIKSSKGVSQSTYETKVKETILQLGGKLEEEELR